MTLTEQTNIIWDDGRIETLRALWADGQTARDIGELLGCSRNAVIGKVHRLGLVRGLQPPIMRQEVDATPRAPHYERVLRIEQRRETEHLAKQTESSDPKPAPGGPRHRKGHKTIVQLGPRDCRWPLGKPLEPATLFCGLRTMLGRPYCDEHCRMGGAKYRGG